MIKKLWQQNIIFSLLLLLIGNFLPCPNLTSGLTAKQALADNTNHFDGCVEMQQDSKGLAIANGHGQKVADCCLEKNTASSVIVTNNSAPVQIIGNMETVFLPVNREIFNSNSYIAPPPRLNGLAHINKKE